MNKRLTKTDKGFRFGERFLPARSRLPIHHLQRFKQDGEREVKGELTCSVSSETPYYRQGWDVWEVLKHGEQNVNLDWLKSGRAPLLKNHQIDYHIGAINNAFLQNKELYCGLRFKMRGEGKECYQDVLEGFLTGVSIGYEIHSAYLEEGEKGEYLIVDSWSVLEVSLTALPADQTVGIVEPMPQGENNNQGGDSYPGDEEETAEEEERKRQKNIYFMSRQFDIPTWQTDLWIKNKTDLNTVSKEAQKMNINYERPIASSPELLHSRGGGGGQNQSWKSLELGLSDRDRANYSLARLLAYKAGFDVPKPELELEASRALGDKLNKDARGLWVPIADLNWTQRSARLQRDALWTGGNGSALVQTSLGEFVSLLRSKIILGQMGATILSGLTGNLDLPKMSQATTVQWIDEGSVIPETDVAFETVELRPCTLASRLPVTRRLLLQASQNYDLELILRQDMITSIAIEADRAAINGSGIGSEPLGLLNNPDVTKLPLGTDGGQLTYDDVINLESAIATNNADIGSLGYIMSPAVRGEMKKTPVEAGTDTFTFEPLPQPDPNMPGAGYVNGYLGQAATTIPNNLTKGSGTGLSALIFGNWSDLYFGEFGAIDVSANPYGRMFPSGGVELRAMMDLSIVPRRIESFAVISDIITS